MRRFPIVLLSLLFAVPSFAADAGFRHGTVHFDAVDSIAFQQDVPDEPKPLTLVVLTSFKIDRPALLAAIDPVSALFAQSGDSGSFALVRLIAPDRCSLFVFLNGGERPQELDFGSFPGKSTTSGSRVSGECSVTKAETRLSEETEFHLPYDLPITAIPKPAALPAGGGEVGTQYVALLKAIQASDWDAAHRHVREGELPETKKKAAESNYFEGLALNYPKTASVTRGRVKGDAAEIEIDGTAQDGHGITGVVLMKKVGADWRVVDQQFYSKQ